MVKKSIIEDILDAFGLHFDREGIAANLPGALAAIRGPKPCATVIRGKASNILQAQDRDYSDANIYAVRSYPGGPVSSVGRITWGNVEQTFA